MSLILIKRPPHHLYKKDRYMIDPIKGCWLWLLNISKDGYALGWDPIRKINITQHQLEYIKKYGPVPEGMELDHKCRVRHCINPDHVEPVTDKENVRRGKVCKLTLEQVIEIKKMLAAGIIQQDIAKKFNVRQTNVSMINRGHTWSDVTI